ncbi:HIRAN domain-containing protein [Spirilliplanes yamanashiensis]|uniref:HIRAN domain-containing protein n=1 Tax=Spirilliplanes yamanashiensis TaxID=42233 RepID=A0A8J4DGK8_9ACTN|nr:HIRAN domain-containing protein [Spirilliplanes yamanashiensis]MDP9814091.1 hypothetical protein [Spirilliplanes yamanashiensis]GIJ00929.1 hypothetical protein Sya03_02810 [Spirilliplanes yamanashiensis]
MGFLQRLLNRRRTDASPAPADQEPRSPNTTLDVVLYDGSHDLEVVGESYYQEALWRAVGGRRTERVRHDIQAVLVAETDNPHDDNAISVWIDGMQVGHLSREDAAAYRTGLLALQAREGRSIALRGVIVGGGVRNDGPGFLGVWMSHDPADFGLAPVVPPPVASMRGAMRTGLTEALLTDAQDDSYDLSWLQRLPADPVPAIGSLRRLLKDDPNPIDRHFMFCELEDRLYRSRDAFSSALQDYDDTCIQHDAEMDGIRDALLTKFGKVPILDTYRQMAIRQQKAKEWAKALWWTERGLSLYGSDCARPEAVDDLNRRAAAYRAKLTNESAGAPRPARPPRAAPSRTVVEALTCAACGASFDRQVTRGRKPQRCPGCR